MSERDAIAELIARVNKTQALLNRIACSYRVFLEEDFKLLGKKNTSAIVISEFIADYLRKVFERIQEAIPKELAGFRDFLTCLMRMPDDRRD